MRKFNGRMILTTLTVKVNELSRLISLCDAEADIQHTDYCSIWHDLKTESRQELKHSQALNSLVLSVQLLATC